VWKFCILLYTTTPIFLPETVHIYRWIGTALDHTYWSKLMMLTRTLNDCDRRRLSRVSQAIFISDSGNSCSKRLWASSQVRVSLNWYLQGFFRFFGLLKPLEMVFTAKIDGSIELCNGANFEDQLRNWHFAWLDYEFRNSEQVGCLPRELNCWALETIRRRIFVGQSE